LIRADLAMGPYALGVLVGSACQIAMAHVGFMLGED
jgi:hypothetical protein